VELHQFTPAGDLSQCLYILGSI